MNDTAAPPGTQAVDRAALLIDTVVRADEPLTFLEIAESSGLPRSTTSRLLSALERTGLLERTESGSYVAGRLFGLYATRHDPFEAVVRLARPTMTRVGKDTGETVHLSVARNGHIVQVAQTDSRYLLGSRDWSQIEVPSHCSSLGKVLYAYGAVELPTGELARPTPTSIGDLASLERDLADVRRRGFAVTVDELEEGLAAVAAPVHGRGRRRRRRTRDLGTHPTTRRPARGARSPAQGPGRAAVGAARTAHPQGGRGMTSPDEILRTMYDETLVGNAPRVLELTNEALAMGMEPQSLLFDSLIPALEEVGARFERGDFFVPEMLIAGRAMAGAMEVLRPLLADTGVETIGKFLMGTVKGDVHDIGKNLVNIMLEGAGFEVIDLGVQVPPEKFVAAIEEHQPDVVGFSAFLTTTMPMFKANMNALEKAGIRDTVIVMVGGAPVTQEYADAVGADGYASDASATVKKAKALLHEKRSKVPA